MPKENSFIENNPRGKPGRPPFWTAHLRREIQVLLDAVVLSAALAISYALRFEFAVPEAHVQAALVLWPLVVGIQLLAAHFSGLYRFVWRYIGISEIQAFLRASAFAGVPLLVLRLALPQQLQLFKMPLSVIVFDAILAFGGLLSVRVLRRLMYERFERRSRLAGRRQVDRQRAVLIGAGRAGVMAVREIVTRGDLGVEPVGFIDDDPLKHGLSLHGVRVLGATRDLAELAERHEVTQAIITISAGEPDDLRRIVAACEQAGLSVKSVPALFELLQGRVSISRLREVRIEDLLRRQPVRLLEPSMRRLVRRRVVMVTGAGGSIGSELSRQILALKPTRLMLFEQAEGALFEIYRELSALGAECDIVPLVGDITDARRVRAVLTDQAPEVVLHAAAHKHVEMMEDNPLEAIVNNTLGTYSLGKLCAEAGVEVFLQISTDKAVRPTSIMGASKRVAEMLVQSLDLDFAGTRFVTVRFGNVLGSAGSVVPIFHDQIRRGGPVTVTHQDATRYFMTIPEAAGLVLEAATLGDGGEVFTLDMGEPVRILDLARDMIRLSGYEEDQIEIEFVGLRQGEKLSEELDLPEEEVAVTEHPKIFVLRRRGALGLDAETVVDRLERLVELRSEDALRRELEELLPYSRLVLESAAPSFIGSASAATGS